MDLKGMSNVLVRAWPTVSCNRVKSRIWPLRHGRSGSRAHGSGPRYIRKGACSHPAVLKPVQAATKILKQAHAACTDKASSTLACDQDRLTGLTDVSGRTPGAATPASPISFHVERRGTAAAAVSEGGL